MCRGFGLIVIYVDESCDRSLVLYWVAFIQPTEEASLGQNDRPLRTKAPSGRASLARFLATLEQQSSSITVQWKELKRTSRKPEIAD